MKRHCLGIFVFTLVCATMVWAQTPTEFKGHDGLIHSVAFSNDGSILATASFDNTVKLWNYSSGKESFVLKGNTAPVNAVAFNNDGTLVATGGQDNSIRMWNPKDGKSVKEIVKAHGAGVMSVAFSPDGKYLASGSADKSVKLWDPKEGKELKNLGSHKESVYNVTFNKDGTQLASCGNDGVIKVWDVKSMTEVKSLLVDLPKKEVKVDIKKVDPVVKDKKEVKKKDMGKKDEPKELRDAFTVVAFTPDGKQVMAAGHDKYVRYFQVSDGKEVKKLGPTPDYIFGLTISKDGKYVATAGYGGSLRVYEIYTGNQVFPEKGKEKEADTARRGWITYCAVFAPDGKSIVTGHEKTSKGIAKVTAVLK